jgi:integrase
MSSTASDNEKPKVPGRRHLRPEEAQKLIAAAGKRGRYPERDKLLLRLAYRHGLRASEAVGLRWDSFDLDGGSLTITRAKSGKISTHTVARDDLGALRKMRKATNGPWVFETVAIGRYDAVHRPLGGRGGRYGRCNPSAHAAAWRWLCADQ